MVAWSGQATHAVAGQLERVVREVIGPLPKIAPKKHISAWLWIGGVRCLGKKIRLKSKT